MDWVDRPQNYKGMYGILQPLQGSRLDNYPLQTPKLSRINFHSVTLQLKCLDFQSNQYINQYMMLVPVFSGFCNKLSSRPRLFEGWITLSTG